MHKTLNAVRRLSRISTAAILLLITLIGQAQADPVSSEGPPTCAECKGGLISLTLKYSGPTATVVVKDSKDTYFSGTLTSGQTFTVTGTKSDGKFQKNNLELYVDGSLDATIHVSCSQPVDVGLVFGSFTIVAGVSKDGGDLCPPPSVPPSCNACDGGLISLTLKYSGPTATVVVKDSEDTYFSGTLTSGQTFTVTGTKSDGKFQKNTLEFYVDGSLDTTIHVSCSQPVDVGLIFGSFTITAGVSKDGGDLCPPTPPEEAMCYLVADNDGIGNSEDAITFVNDLFAESFIGMSGTLHIEALAYVPTTGILYGSDADTFGSINLTTGVFTPIGLFGSGNGVQGSKSFTDIDGLTYDPFTGIMYASVRKSGDDLLIQVDIATGAAIVDAFGAGKTYVPVIPPVGGNDDVDDIAISSVDGTMYAIMNENGTNSHLIIINKATGTTTDVTDLDVENVEGLGFHPDGRFLGVLGDSGRKIVEINPVTGVTTQVSNLGVNGFKDYEGIACLTEPQNQIRGTVYLENRIDLELEKTADASQLPLVNYTITIENSSVTLPTGPNPVTGTGTGGLTVELYRDANTSGTVDLGDFLLATTITAGDGSYGFDISATGAFVMQVDLSSVPDLAVNPTDNVETAVFVGFGNTDSNNDFYFFNFTDATGVDVKDLLPTGVTYVSDTPSQGTFNSGTGIWTIGTMPTGAIETLMISVTQTAQSVENCAEVWAANETDVDSTPANANQMQEDDDDCVTTELEPKIDLELEKTATAPDQSGNVTYTVTVDNRGPGTATDVEVTDMLPAGVSYMSHSSSQGTYNNGTGLWTIGTMTNGATVTLDIVAHLLNNQSTTINCAEVSNANETDVDSTPGNASVVSEDDDDCTPGDEPNIDLELEKTASNYNPDVGDTITFTITLTNNGPGTAHNVDVSEQLPTGVSFVSYVASAGTYNNVTGIWTVPSIAPSTSETLTITVTIIGFGGSGGTPVNGVYRLYNHPGNSGVPPPHGLRLDELFGGFSGITFDFDHPSSSVYMEIDGSTIKIWGQVFGGYDIGATYHPVYSGLWDLSFEYTDKVSLASPDDDLWVAGGNAALSNGWIIPQFSTDQFDAYDVFNVRDRLDAEPFSFRLGDDDDDLGINGYVGISGFGWLMYCINGDWNIAANAFWSFIAIPENPVIENCVEIMDADENDIDSTPGNGIGNGEDDEDCITINADPEIDLSLEKSVDNGSASVGGTATFTLDVENAGDVLSTATNITISDRIPAGMFVLSTNPANNVVIDNVTHTVTWVIPSLSPGQLVSLDVLVRIDQPGVQENCAQVWSADQSDRDSYAGDGYENGQDDDDCATVTTPDPFIDLSLQKTVDENTPTLGQNITYTLRLENNATASVPATGINVVDDLPVGIFVLSTDPTIGVTFNNVTHTLSWFVPYLAPGDYLELEILARVDQAGNSINCAEVATANETDVDSTPGNADTVNEDDDDCVTTTTEDPTIDLELEKTVNQSNPALDDNVVYTLAVTNNASNATETATGVYVTDVLPAGVSWVSDDGSTSVVGNTITWGPLSIPDGGTAVLNITVKINSYGTHKNCAEVTAADQTDVDSTPNNGVENGEDDQDCVTIRTDPVPDDLMCYLVAGNDGPLGGSDVLTYINTGFVEFSIGQTGTFQIQAIEYVADSGTLYAADGSRFGTLNMATGVFSPIGPFGSGYGDLGIQTFSDVDALALDPFTGVLYGIVRRSGNDLLIQVDMFTGSAVLNAFGPGKTYVPISTVAGSDDVDGLAIDPDDGVMYAVASGGNPTHLITIDKLTGVATDVNILGPPDILGLGFDDNGNLFGVRDCLDNELVSIDTTVGSISNEWNLGADCNFRYETVTCFTQAPNHKTGTVFLDANEDGVLDGGDTGQGEVTVELYRDLGTPGVFDGDLFLGTTTTAPDGAYVFPILSSGNFILQVDSSTLPAGAVFTTDNVETVHFTGVGENHDGNDFGFKIESFNPGSIGDFVFDDLNGDGDHDIGEPGIGGVLLRLYSGSCPPAGSPIAVRVTNPSGGYLFTGLPAGTYCVDVVEATIPSGYIHTTANDPMTVVLGPAENFLDADFGYWFNLIQAQADLELVKEVNTSAPALNDIVTFTITVVNKGPADATNLIVRDVVPVGLLYVDANPSQGGFDATNGFWTIGTLANGGMVTLEFRTRVVITNMIENIAQVSSVDQPDPDSTPSNGVPSEDDQDNAIVETRGPGSSGDILRVECADMGTINALAYDQVGNLLFAGSESGNIHISNDDGLNWPIFLQTDNDAPVRDIVVWSGGTTYAGTLGDGVYKSTNGGDNWTNIGPTQANINDLDLADASGAVYAADHGRVIVYNGTTWTEVGIPTNPFGGGQVQAVVYDDATGRVFATVDGLGVFAFSGGAWSSVNSGLPIGKINALFRGPSGQILAGTNSDGVYIFGGTGWIQLGMGLDDEPIESLGTGPNGELLAGARESGAYYLNFISGEWISIGNLPIFTVDAIIAGQLGEVYIGAPGEGIYVIYDTDFDGVPDQSHLIANFLTNAIIQGLVVAPNGDMWAATYGYGILYSNDGGQCWTRMNRGLENLWTFSIARRTDGTLFIGIWADGKGGVWRSRDNGRNWEFLALPDRQIVSLTIDPNNEDIIYAGANLSGVGAIYRSFDGGDTWTVLNSFIQPVWSVSIDPDDSNRIVVGTLGDGIWESLDAGASWTQIGHYVNGLGNPYVFELQFAPVGSPFAGELFAGTDAGVYRYDGFTNSWTLFGINSADYQIRTLAFVGTTIFAGTWNAGVVEYVIATNSWEDYGLADIPVVAFAMHENTQTLVIGTSGQGLFLSPNMNVATDTEDLFGGEEMPSSFELHQNYPNPFNPVTTVPFDVRETGQIRIVVYDILGRQVAVLIDRTVQPGQHQVRWEAGDHPSGTYLIRMETANQVFTRPIVLLK